MNTTFRIGNLSKQTGVKVVTIRYYEQAGLLPVCERTAGNYRLYSKEHVQRLHFLRRCRGLGFSLEQVRDLLQLSAAEESSCAHVCELAEHHLQDVEARIKDLKRLASELRQITSSCNGSRAIADCRIIAALSRS